jgi:hypothetical protein
MQTGSVARIQKLGDLINYFGDPIMSHLWIIQAGMKDQGKCPRLRALPKGLCVTQELT